MFLPDPAREVDSLVSVPGERQGEEVDAGIYMVDILVRKASLLERLVPGITEGASLVPAEQVLGDRTEEERRQESLNEMTASQQVAIAVALQELGYEVRPRGAEILRVLEGAPADGKLRVGDVIVAAEGTEVGDPADLSAAFEEVPPGRSVELRVERDGATRPLKVGTRAAEGDPERAVMGVIVQPEFDFPVNVSIDAGSIGGPSAGLAFALDVVDELGDDVDGGRRVVVTGELDLDGRVQAIGGVKQKTIGARRADADVFLVPDANAAEARRYADGLEIVAVSSFDEALSYLTTE